MDIVNEFDRLVGWVDCVFCLSVAVKDFINSFLVYMTT